MPLLLIIFLILISCSSDLIYNEPTPRLSVEAGFYRVPDDKIFRNADTLLLGSQVRFQAGIKPLASDAKNFYWIINSLPKIPFLSFPRTFNSRGIYNIEFYVVDYLNDTLKVSSTIIVSDKPVCEENLNLTIFQGSPIFSWKCHDEDEKLTYNFKLRDNDKKRIIADTTLQKDSLQFGFVLPENFDVHLTASNSYGFKAELDSTWSSHE